MTIPVELFGALVTTATAITTLAPVVLLVLWVRDARQGRLW